MPPATQLSLPQLPASLRKPVEPIGQLPDGSMGTLATDNVSMVDKYARLGVRFWTLVELYDCVREQVNTHKAPETCLDRQN